MGQPVGVSYGSLNSPAVLQCEPRLEPHTCCRSSSAFPQSPACTQKGLQSSPTIPWERILWVVQWCRGPWDVPPEASSTPRSECRAWGACSSWRLWGHAAALARQGNTSQHRSDLPRVNLPQPATVASLIRWLKPWEPGLLGPIPSRQVIEQPDPKPGPQGAWPCLALDPNLGAFGRWGDLGGLCLELPGKMGCPSLGQLKSAGLGQPKSRLGGEEGDAHPSPHKPEPSFLLQSEEQPTATSSN